MQRHLHAQAVEAHARRFVNRRSEIVRGPDALRRSTNDAHTYAPPDVALDTLPSPTEGLIANVSLEMKNGKLVGTVPTKDVTHDDVLGMIILGKMPDHLLHLAGPGATNAPNKEALQ